MSRYLSAYYFMGTDLCMNPAHIREDMLFLAAHHYDAIHVAVHEQQLKGKPYPGLALIIREARRAGLEVFAIPSRWCGLIAGWPDLAGHFAASRPDVWMRKEDGSHVIKGFCGPLCSVHHPDVRDYMIDCTKRMMELYGFDGITWDELKTLHETDYHPIALEKFGGPVSGEKQIEATLEIFEACNQMAKSINSKVRIVSFLYAHLDDAYMRPWAAVPGFDEIGPDGDCARGEDEGRPPESNKVLIDHSPRFIEAAAENGKGTFALIETQFSTRERKKRTLMRLDEFLSLGINHIATYYRPLTREDDADPTDEISQRLRDWRSGQI